MALRTENKIILCPKNRCRICLETTNGKMALNQTINYKKAEISLNELLEFCVNEQVSENGKADGLCLACMEKGIVCYEFKKKFEESQSILLKEIEEGNSLVIKTEEDFKEEDLVEITENKVLKEEISDEEVLTENDETVNEEILKDDVLVVATENGVLKEEISDEEAVTESVQILKEESLDEEMQIKCHEDQQDVLNTPGDKPTAISFKGKKGSLMRHKLEHSSLEQENTHEYKCEVCEKTFKLRNNFVQHTRRHRQKVFRKQIPCPTCGKIFFKKNLNVHMMTHSGEKPFPCEFCERSFSQRGNLDTHHRRIHSGERPYKCSECGKGFALKTTLSKHLDVHSKKREHVCHICDAAFVTSCTLRVHIKRHTAERPFKCTICSRSFKLSSSLKEHMVIHTGVRNYACEFCNKRFNRSSGLTRHRKIHTGEIPHVCKVCGDGFIESSSLKRHMTTHRVLEREYPCEFCKKRYKDNKSLRDHRNIHTGETPHVCKVCGKGFIYSSNLIRHRKTH